MYTGGGQQGRRKSQGERRRRMGARKGGKRGKERENGRKEKQGRKGDQSYDVCVYNNLITDPKGNRNTQTEIVNK
jgi:hypothetical protein